MLEIFLLIPIGYSIYYYFVPEEAGELDEPGRRYVGDKIKAE